ncbi:MAG: glycosyltransferase [Candidatus Sericytochromatia bacterium]|nr:glycosyltransferase [Candidatus Sericytochromatia bacterium]
MRVLVLVQAYPSQEKPYNQAYVHARVLHYLQQGWQVDVLSFASQEPYLFEGVQILPETALNKQAHRYDVWVSHAPNLRNHLRLILKWRKNWQRLVWVIHGHEVLIKAHYYPPPYPWMPQTPRLKKFADRAYDALKVRILAKFLDHYLPRQKIQLIFVSQWMKEAFETGVKLSCPLAQNRFSIIANPVHPLFLQTEWVPPSQPAADFITLRPLDEPKYAVDLVYQLAQDNPHIQFHLYGQGRFFQYHPPLPNLTWFDRFCTQAEIPALLANYRAALMPTRLDAQGVMACEMATLGIPVLTSDLPVCREMLKGFPRTGFLSRSGPTDLSAFLAQSLPERGDFRRFSPEQTVAKEIQVIASGKACDSDGVTSAP